MESKLKNQLSELKQQSEKEVAELVDQVESLQEQVGTQKSNQDAFEKEFGELYKEKTQAEESINTLSKQVDQIATQ